jgi:hypothetical protein
VENTALSQHWSVQIRALHGFVLNRQDDAAIKMPMNRAALTWAPVGWGAFALIALAGSATAGPHDALISKHASAYGVPETLVRRVIRIESKGNARIVSKGNYGLMQIRLGTAHSMGYRGTAEGLLDADTNMTYAVKYLAGAYRAAGCSEERAISYYQRGFYKKQQSKCAAPRSANVQVASKDSASAAGEFAVQRSRSAVAERDAAPPADVLRPKVVRVETFTRPKPQSAPPMPMQLASAPTAPAPAAAASVAAAPARSAVAPVAVAPVAIAPAVPVEARPPAVQLPQSPPLPVAARRPAVTPPPPPQTTMAKASEPEQAWPPPVLPEPSLLSMQPMPKPRPAQAPKAFEMQMAKLDPDAVPLPQRKPEPEAATERQAKPPRRAAHRHVRTVRRPAETPALLAWFQKLTTPAQPAQPTRRRR